MLKRVFGRFRTRTLVLAAISLCFVIVILALSVSWSVYSNSLYSQQAAQRYSGESGQRFSQVTVFFPKDYELSTDSVRSFRESVIGSIESDDPRFQDAYAAKGSLGITNGTKNTSVSAFYVGGDWFAFHPLRLLSGNYISESDLMHDKIVIDKTAAWRLFGSSNAAGMTVTIAGEPYLIAGVVEMETDSFSSRARKSEQSFTTGEAAFAFLPFDLVEKFSGSDYTFEAVLPDPVTGAALKYVQNSSLGSGDIVENTGRFGLLKILKLMYNFSDRSLRVSSTTYPYYENASRLLEGVLSLYSVIIMILGLVPVIFVIIVIVHYSRRLRKHLRRRKIERDALYGVD